MTCCGDWQPVPFGAILPETCHDCLKRQAGADLTGEVVDGKCEIKEKQK